MSLRPIVDRLRPLIGHASWPGGQCWHSRPPVWERLRKMVRLLESGQVLLLENLRFHAEEEKNDPAFAKQLAKL